MSVLNQIEKIIAGYSPHPYSIKSGNNLSAQNVMSLSEQFKGLNILRESIIVASFGQEKARYLLTDKHFYFQDRCIEFSELNAQMIQTFPLTEQEKSFLKHV
ncbi:MAG: hypothetical protein HC906_06775, partial [Bacteroidales bacterium]|nr:hypothetical protein [Bacteroidales bacterium]